MVDVFMTAIALSTSLVTAALPAAITISPASIRAEIKASGAKATVERLYASHQYETVLMQRIGDGSVPWIMLAPALSSGTDAATSEKLGEALIYALPKSPAAVLSVIDLSGSSAPLAPERVCSASFYEGDPTDPVRYRASAIRAVEQVADPRLASAKRQCLIELRKAKQ